MVTYMHIHHVCCTYSRGHCQVARFESGQNMLVEDGCDEALADEYIMMMQAETSWTVLIDLVWWNPVDHATTVSAEI